MSNANRATGRSSDQFAFRFPDGMREKIKAEAERNRRSMNAELIARLEASFFSRELHGEIAAVVERHVEAEVRSRLNAIASRIGEQG